MTLVKKLFPLVLVLFIANGSLFGYNPEDKYVDIETASKEVNDRQTQVDQLRTEVDSLVKDTAEQESIVQDRTNKILKVEDALEKMNGTIADMLKIMGEMNDSKARLKFQDSISSGRETRDELIVAHRSLSKQINDANEKIEQNRYNEFIALSKIDRLTTEIEILREQIARTEVQEQRLDNTIQIANKSLQEVESLIGDIDLE
ncbi:MAG: hypothetical protein JXB03_01120 [Spirochaetales bacterium]|nr:hypothetical protein [Spirochaetales bacterium]